MMPKYSYSCSACGNEFETYHSMFEAIDRCIICEAFDISRKPSSFFASTSPNKAGALVKQHIEEAKREVKEEKEKLTKEYHD